MIYGLFIAFVLTLCVVASCAALLEVLRDRRAAR